MNVVVIGCGHWGKNHVRVLDGLGHLYGLCDIEGRGIARLKKGHRLVWSLRYIDYNYALEDPNIDAVIIATPSETHCQIAIDALKAGKHVLVEKPMAMNTEDAENMRLMAEVNDRVLMVGHILNYHPAITRLKQFIWDGEIGDVQYIYSNRLNIGRIRRNENVIQSFAPHDISVILSILNTMPSNVRVESGEFLSKGIPDITLMHLDFPDNIKAHIFVSWLHPVKEQKLVIIGDKGMVVFDPLSDKALKVYEHKISWEGQDDVATIKEAEYKILSWRADIEPLKNELNHFIEYCEQGTRPLTDGREGLNVLKVMEMASEKDKIKPFVVSGEHGGKIMGKVKEFEAGLHRNSLWKLAGIFVHKSSYIDDDVEIGEGTKIWHYSHVQRGAIIGKNCTLGQNVNIGPGVKIGDNVKIQNNVSVYEGVTIEKDVFIGPSVVFTNVKYREQFGRRDFTKTLVCIGAKIGANSTIICGVTIGTCAFIGAGSVVTKDVKALDTVYGNPARVK